MGYFNKRLDDICIKEGMNSSGVYIESIIGDQVNSILKAELGDWYPDDEYYSCGFNIIVDCFKEKDYKWIVFGSIDSVFKENPNFEEGGYIGLETYYDYIEVWKGNNSIKTHKLDLIDL